MTTYSSPQTPLVSVVIPTQRRRTMLDRALQSVFAQTHAHLQIVVVVDPHSQTRPPAMPPPKDPRVEIVVLPGPSGAAQARNAGLARAHGEWTAFLDDDDEWLPSKIEQQLDTAAATNAGLVYCGYELVSDNGPTRITPWIPKPEGLTDLDFLRDTAFNCSVPLIRTALLNSVGGFDPALPSVQDKDLWIRLIRRTVFARVPAVLVHQHIHGRQMTAELERKIAGRRLIIDKYRPLLERAPDLYARFLERLGLMECCIGHRNEGLSLLRKAATYAPLSDDAAHILHAAQDKSFALEKHIAGDVFRSIDGVTLYY